MGVKIGDAARAGQFRLPSWLLALPLRRAWPRSRRLRCSFCGRSSAEVDRLVAGASAHICDACVAKCVAVLDEHGGSAHATPEQ